MLVEVKSEGVSFNWCCLANLPLKDGLFLGVVGDELKGAVLLWIIRVRSWVLNIIRIWGSDMASIRRVCNERESILLEIYTDRELYFMKTFLMIGNGERIKDKQKKGYSRLLRASSIPSWSGLMTRWMCPPWLTFNNSIGVYSNLTLKLGNLTGIAAH